MLSSAASSCLACFSEMKLFVAPVSRIKAIGMLAMIMNPSDVSQEVLTCLTRPLPVLGAWLAVDIGLDAVLLSPV
jgi:hypothetical protein